MNLPALSAMTIAAVLSFPIANAQAQANNSLSQDSSGGNWGAIAVALTHTRVRASSGLNYHSEDEARRAVLAHCRKQGVPGCKVVGTFTSCGYVSVGKSERRRRVGWGTGATADAALEQCRSRGISCDKPIGGCNN